MTHHSDTEISELIASLTGFTPGPWEARRSVVHVGGKGTLASVTNPWNNEQEREANARLIAAAPQLLSALQSLLADKARMEEALAWAEDHEPWLVDQIRERAALSTITPKEAE